MTTLDAQRLLDLLPAIYRIRDIELARSLDLLSAAEIAELTSLEASSTLATDEQARLTTLRLKADTGPLGALLSVVAEQLEALEEDIEQLYDDQFIETCAEWVAPYIGDLVGYRPLHGVLPALASPRADVANTIAFRRRKGTLPMLEQLAASVTGWPARAVEFFQLLGWTQNMNHVRRQVTYAPDLRRHPPADPAFDTTMHTVDVRRVNSGGRYNIPNVGLYLWRIGAYSLTRALAVADPIDPTGRLLRFNPLGKDTQLFTRPKTEDDIGLLAGPLNLPLPIERRWLVPRLADYYGANRSFFLEHAGDPPEPIDAAAISVCNLSDIVDGGGNVSGWAHVPATGSGHIAVDPVLGRIAFADPPPGDVLASFHYGFSAPIGGGEYERGDPPPGIEDVTEVSGGGSLQTALDGLAGGGLLEIDDSLTYEAPATIKVDAGKSLLVRASNGSRPLLLASTPIALDLAPGATLVLDGLVISGAPLTLADAGDDERRTLTMSHCTLVPGSAGFSSDDPSIVVQHAFTTLSLDSCITGALHVVEDADVSLRDSILDATGDDLVAYRGPSDLLAPGGAISLTNVTVIGRLHARLINEATNTLFVASLPGGDGWRGPVWADRRQAGCIRFSYLPAGSRTPRRYQCQPPERGGDPDMAPHFTSLLYGRAGYCQLAASTPEAIRHGAEDESEIGVFHSLFQPQRETNLRLRLEEYLRFGLEAAIIYAS